MFTDLSRHVSIQAPRRAAITVALAVTIALTPAPGRSDEFSDFMNRTAILLGCSLGTLDCRPARAAPQTRPRRTTPGRADAVALTRDQKRIVQDGLTTLGHYTGPLDGLFGRGTRTAIRAYQGDRGAKRTGYLTDEQTAALMRAAPDYAALDDDDPRLFEIDFHEDLSPDDRRRLQAALNDRGFDAGRVDGVVGRRTRQAIAAYKTEAALGGPARATSRLLAALTDGAPVRSRDIASPRQALRDVPETPDPPPPTIAEQPGYDILGLQLGVRPDQTAPRVAEVVGTKMTALSGTAVGFTGNAILGEGQLVLRNDAADPLADQIALFYDPSDPDGGAVAILRSFLLPEDVTEDDARLALAQKYGTDTRIGDSLIWIEDPGMRLTIEANPSAVGRCGRLSVTFGDDTAWNGIGGPRLDADLLDTFDTGCGAVVTAQIGAGRMTVVMWDSDRIMARKAELAAEAAAQPKIKL